MKINEDTGVGQQPAFTDISRERKSRERKRERKGRERKRDRTREQFRTLLSLTLLAVLGTAQMVQAQVISISDASTTESAKAWLKFRLTSSTPVSEDIIVNVRFEGITADIETDLVRGGSESQQPSLGILLAPADDVDADFSVVYIKAADDNSIEQTETFRAIISPNSMYPLPSGVTIGRNTGIGTIFDNDGLAVAPVPVPDPAPDPDPVPDPVPDPEPVPNPAPDPEPVPDPDPELDPELQPGPFFPDSFPPPNTNTAPDNDGVSALPTIMRLLVQP